MKKKISLTTQMILVLLLVGCGGSLQEEINDNYAANNATINYSYNTADEPAVEDSSGRNFPSAPAATAVPIGAQPSQPQSSDQRESIPGVNGYQTTAYDNLSTFGIDVDTASYTQAKNYIENEDFPPSDSIRVEEFINYFDSGYPIPDDVAFGLFADGAPSPFNHQDTLLRFGIQGYDISEADRKPLALTFVIDVSGSMDADDRLGLVKQSLNLLVERLRPDDTVGIVIFGSNARVILHPTRGHNKVVISNAIHSLRSNGSTNAEQGLRMAYNMAFENFNSRAVNRVILCSDGVANVGQTTASSLLEFIEDYAEIGINLTTTGFGMGTYNDSLMEELADKGNGNYSYVDDLDEAQRLFVDDLTSTMLVIAKDTKIQVDFNPEIVSHYRLVGYENRAIADEDFRDDNVDAGELGAGHSVTALYAIRINPEVGGRIATLQLRWEDPDTGEVVEISGDFNTWDLNEDYYNTSPHFQLAAVSSQFAEILRGSPFSGNMEIGDLLPNMYVITTQLPDDRQVTELTSLILQASLLDN